MFFKTAEITAEILTVLELGWERVSAKAEPRRFHALSLRLVGGASFFYNGERLTVEEGDITFAPAGLEFHKEAEEGKILVIHFTAKEPLPREFLRFKPKNPRYFIDYFTELQQVWLKKQVGYEHQAKMLFYKILYEMEREWAEKKPSGGRLTEVFDYIHGHFIDQKLSVERLAARCGMSDTYFRRLFTAEFGITPLKYINALRLHHAKELLRADYYTVEEIAELCGFNNINYFSFFIKKETGLSPLALRKALLKEIKA